MKCSRLAQESSYLLKWMLHSYMNVVFGKEGHIWLGAIFLLRKKNSGWVGSSNDYNCLFTLHKSAIFGMILLIMWVGWYNKGENYAYVIKV